MKIAIYGDSYANLNLDQPNDGRGMSWVDCIKKDHEVTNFGMAGTSVFYSYLKFKEHNEKFDYNIFIITHLDRIYNRKLNELINQESWYTNHNHIKFWAKQKYNVHQQKIIDSVQLYQQWWKDEETESILNFNLIENLRKEHDNNCLFIHAFSKNFNPILKNEYGLLDITVMEQTESGWLEKYSNNNMHLGHLDENNRMLQDYRLNHLCEENNIILGSKILEAVNSNETMLEITLKDFVKPPHDIDFYVKWFQK